MDKKTLRRLLLGEFSVKRLLRSLLFVYGFLICYAFFFADELIPFWHGQALFKATQAPKRFLWIDQAGHNDLGEVAGDRYSQALQQFALLLSADGKLRCTLASPNSF